MGEDSDHAAAFGAESSSLPSGRREHFATEYPCHSPLERLPCAEGPTRAAFVHEKVTQRKRRELQLRHGTPE